VGKKTPNRLGLYDMSGNVREWCYDWYGTVNTETAPIGAASGSVPVNRGGGWSSSARSASVSYRDCDYPYNRGDFLGIRVVRSSSNKK
ncbi:formylglycine-generating enzyme family protein, partial [Treponema sp.]|uniref:formylglycine-generating enzyme family protein n=1 Tax=Treponema sp. TaxID=166 RepID=UPI00298DA163